ncbi:MAG: PQQ-binding-like beta-propeller repeat protein, partial [Planctomycetes bacterium]|nr:PQQ-binding-like beta-propeller repeat protein [Planctomycetota bacterium]
VYQRALSPDEISQRYEERRELFPEPVRLALGPYAEFVGPETAIVRWHTRTPSPTRLEYRSGDKLFTVSDSVPKIEHEARLSQLQRDRIAQYWVKTGRERQRSTPVFELDGHFNYSVPRVQEVSIPSAANENIVDWTAIAEQILLETGVRSGICLVLGWESGQLAYEIARHSDLRVVGVDTDPDKVESARETLRRCGVYGTRVALHVVESLSKLPFTSSFANLVVSESIVADGLPVSAAAEVSRVLRPDGGVAVLGRLARGKHGFSGGFLSAWLESSGTEGELQVSDDGVWARVVRPPLNGAGEWSHLYGRADNAAFGGEMLSGVRSSSDLRVQWIGRPGPRGQPDRNGRKPSPLSTGGRLFVQGSHRLMGLDAYNGTILWGLEIPLLERFNMPRDSSNWCADKEHLFVAIRNRCWQIDALSGQVVKFHAPIAAKRRGWKYDWSYLARLGETILGSSVKSGTGYTNFWGGAGAGWYDARSGPATFKVCSDNLFAITKATGEVAWKYEDGVIINSTITAADKRVFFVECRNAEVKASFSRRVGMNDLWHDLYLVALDGASGSVLWEKPLGTTAGTVVFYMAYGSNLLVIVSSSDKRYDVYGYNAFTGDLAWHNGFGWPEGKGDHGRAMSRPAIVGGRVFVRPQVLDLYTGKTLPLRMPAGGCGTYAATANTFIYRSEKKVSLWDSDSGEKTAWERLRPGCWLSTIPAAGMLLSPEAGGGCSCGSWMETSIGFTPLSGGGGGGSTEE